MSVLGTSDGDVRGGHSGIFEPPAGQVCGGFGHGAIQCRYFLRGYVSHRPEIKIGGFGTLNNCLSDLRKVYKMQTILLYISLCFQYQLGLPIKIEIGLIGKIILKIPWSSLFSQPIVICIEVQSNTYMHKFLCKALYIEIEIAHMDIFVSFKDIYAVAVPALSGPYDPEIQKRLIRAEKRKILEDLKEDEIFRAGNQISFSFQSDIISYLNVSLDTSFFIAI